MFNHSYLNIMAKSKTGGSRAYIRGRIGSDVYSVGKDGKGQRQQVVRSLAEQVSNPRTQSQMFGRMIMSTVMQAVSALQPIIDHSFDGLAKGQPSISEFIRQNYALVKADAIAHPASSNKFGLNKYQEKGAKPGQFVISSGDVIVPATVIIDNGNLLIGGLTAASTVADLLAATGVAKGDYMTYVYLGANNGLKFARISVKETVADTTVLSDANLATMFNYEGNVTPAPSIVSSGLMFEITTPEATASFGVILSVKADSAWKHSKTSLFLEGATTWTADDALPTYPTGTEQFLNGGDL